MCTMYNFILFGLGESELIKYIFKKTKNLLLRSHKLLIGFHSNKYKVEVLMSIT